MEENFDYGKALAELEKIAQKVEDPSTGIDEIGKLISSSDKLIADCREYLRSTRDSLKQP